MAHSAENDAPIYHSRWIVCEGCGCSTVIENVDAEVPEPAEWEEFGRCLVCGSSQLDWNADEDTIADRYWRMGRKAAEARVFPPGEGS